ncbi:MAG: NAD-dependent epimerase/dehydratase family protein [bacterium]
MTYRLLITGALGHIGSKFIHSIQPGEFEEIRLLDNVSTQRYSSLFNLPAGVKFKFFEEDIRCTDLDTYFKDIDIVIHLAAITDATTSFDKAKEVEEVNFLGTKNVAMACMRNNCRLLFPSTTSVYGVQNEIVDEECPSTCLKPQSPYAKSKLDAENYVRSLDESTPLRYIICRLGTIFGTSIGMRFHTAVNKFCWQAVRGLPITVWRAALHQKRPYLDLNDAMRAFRFIIRKDLFDCSIYNVLTINTTVDEIVKSIAAHVSDVSIKYVDSEIMNQLSYTVSNDRFSKQGFEFQGNLENGIEETMRLLNGIRQKHES